MLLTHSSIRPMIRYVDGRKKWEKWGLTLLPAKPPGLITEQASVHITFIGKILPKTINSPTNSKQNIFSN